MFKLAFLSAVFASVVVAGYSHLSPPRQAAGCDVATVQANLAEMKVVANQILATGLVLPDPFREAATFDTVVSAIATATTATAASDFATAKTQIADINTKIDGLLDGKLWTGVVSGSK
ncbi:hypothetical protein B0H15DRAFT_951755 [Mycena belliarum]|uniref:Antifreeze protein n=1 Tax=Mycena belliarum TaxID=1033014 RepID=A0AAD6U0I5_9AGAR|nr:hypothetical protein B0H15DRAFT_956792 [Mycena belliae]KAJ7084004.1 hypothetical protein B0H15DRAFT_951755 [Mycena belliae]